MRHFRIMVVAAAISACAGQALYAADKKPASLYERLGGRPAIEAVVDDFVARFLADERVNAWFARVASDPERMRVYKGRLSDLICQATGGPYQYTGADMFAVHKDKGITEDAFNAIVSDLVATLEKLKVPEKERAQLLGILGPMKPAIVQEKK